MDLSRHEVLERFVLKHVAERRGRPVVVGVIGDFTGRHSPTMMRPALRDRRFITMTPQTFNKVLASLRPSLSYQVPASLEGDERIAVELKFCRLSDFDPIAIAHRVTAIATAMGELAALRERGAGDEAATVERRIDEQLNAVLHAPSFLELEAAWRGLSLLVTGLGRSKRCLVRILDVTKAELFKDFDRAVEFDQSTFFKHTYDHTLGMFGGRPFDLLIANYFLSESRDDVVLLEQMASAAAASATPVLIGVVPSFFGVTDFTALANTADPARVQPAARRALLRSLRDSQDLRWVSLLTPRVLLRPPHHLHEFEVAFHEAAERASDRLWGHPAFLVGLELARAFATHGFRRSIPGLSTGSLVRANERVMHSRLPSSLLEFDYSQPTGHQLAANGVTALWTPGQSGRVAYRAPSGFVAGGSESDSARAGWPVSHLMIAGRLYKDTRILLRGARGLMRITDEDASELRQLVRLWSDALGNQDGASLDIDVHKGWGRWWGVASTIRFDPLGGERLARPSLTLEASFFP